MMKNTKCTHKTTHQLAEDIDEPVKEVHECVLGEDGANREPLGDSRVLVAAFQAFVKEVVFSKQNQRLRRPPPPGM